jgi:hypothetical protein
VTVMPKARHWGTVTCRMAVDDELTTHGATHYGGVLCEEEGVVYAPHEFSLVCELDIGW